MSKLVVDKSGGTSNCDAEDYPLSTGRHSLRIGVDPEKARGILSRIHQNAIEMTLART